MSKVQALRCDRCTVVFEDFEGRKDVRTCVKRCLVHRWDLCPGCFKALVEFVTDYLKRDA
jgi:hypothetical protein